MPKRLFMSRGRKFTVVSIHRTATRAILATGLFGVLIGSFGTLFVPSIADAINGNAEISFQGKVVNTDGTNVADASYTFVFKLYTVSSAGSAIWTETKSVSTTDGVFQTNLGDTTALPGGTDANLIAGELYLGVNFNANGEMTPRIKLTTAAYSLYSQNSNELGGFTASQFAQLTPGSAQSGLLNVTGTVNGQTIQNAASFVTSVTAPTINATTSYQANGAAGQAVNCAAGQANLGAVYTEGILTTGGTCTTVAAGTFLAKNAADTSTVSALGQLYVFTNNNTGAAGVLSLVNAGTNAALSITQNGNPASGQALILANDTAGTPTGNLLDLQVGGASKLSVDTAGNVTQAGGTSTTDTINGQRISAAANFTGTVTAATSVITPLVQTADLSSGSSDTAAAALRSGNISGTSTGAPGNVTVDSGSPLGGTIGGGGFLYVGNSFASQVNIGNNKAPIKASALASGSFLQVYDSGATNSTKINFVIPNSGTTTYQFVNPSASNNTYNICTSDSASCNGGGSIGAGYIQNQTASTQTAGFNISGNGTLGGNLSVTGSYNTNTFTSSALTFGGASASLDTITTASSTGLNLAASNTSIWSTSAGNLTIQNSANSQTLFLNETGTSGTVSVDAPTINLGTSNATRTIGIGNVGTTGTQAITIGGSGNTANTVSIEAGTGAGAIVIGNGATAHNIQIGTNGTAAQVVGVGSANSGSTFTAKAGATTQSLTNTGATIQTTGAANSATAFQLQNFTGANVLDASTVDTNLIANPGGEVAIASTDWPSAGYGAGVTVSRTTSTAWSGLGAIAAVTGANAKTGAKNIVTAALATGTTYTLSFYAKVLSGAFTDIEAGYSYDSNAAHEVACGSYNTQTIVTGGWTRITCDFATSATTGTTGQAYVYIVQTAGTARTFYLDGVQLDTTNNVATVYGAGSLQVDAVITAPLGIQNTEDSTTAFTVQTAAGANLLNVDTLNSKVTVGSSSGTVVLPGLTTVGPVYTTSGGVLSSEALLAPVRGGTGVNGSAAGNGTLLIGNGSGYTLTTLTGTGNRLSVANASGSITLNVDATQFPNSAGASTILESTGANAASWVSNIAANTCSDCLVKVPTAGQNVIAPTANSVVGLTVKGTTGTAADVLDIYNSAGSPTPQAFFDSAGSLNVSQLIQPTANNTLDVGKSGTTFRTGYFGTSVVSPHFTGTGAVSLTSGGANALTIDAGGAAAINIGTASANAISLGKSTATTNINGTTQIGTLNTAGTGALINNGSTTNTEKNITDRNSGGSLSIGTNTTTVDIYTYFSITQTTPGQTITIPTPTASTTYGKIIYISNIGTTSFTLLGTIIGAGSTATLVWSNTNVTASWTYAGADGSGILNQSANDQTADFRISGTGQANTKFIAPLFDSITGGLLLGTSTATSVTLGGSNATAVTLQPGSGDTPTINLNAATIATNQTGAVALFNTNATTVNAFGAASTIALGASGTTVNLGGSGAATLATTTGALSVTSAAALSLTGAANSIWTVGSTHTLAVTSSDFSVTAAGVLTLAGAQSPADITVTAAAANAAGKSLTLQSGAADGTSTGNIGGDLNLKAGAAAGSSAHNGGGINVTAGAASGSTGTGGLVVISAGAASATSGSAGGSIQVTAAAGNVTAGAGGSITLQAGNAVGNGNAGGNISFTAGTATGTGVPGVVSIDTPVFTAVTEPTFTQTANNQSFTMTQANVDGASTIIANVGGAFTGATVTVPAPKNLTSGRIIYVTVASGSVSFTLTPSGGPSLYMSSNTTAQLIWNQTALAWTGGAADTSLQAVYNDTASATASIVTTSNTKVIAIQAGSGFDVNKLFSVQNAAGNVLFNVDTSGTGTITLGDSNGGNTAVITPTGLTLNGTARHAKTIKLTAEYAGAVLDTGGQTSVTGTMTAGFDSTQRMGYYKWLSSQATAQTYDIVVNVPIPDDWGAWSATNPSFYTNAGGTSGTTLSTGQSVKIVSITKSDGTSDASFTNLTISPTALSTWTTNNATALAGTGYSAGGIITIRIRLSAITTNASSVQMGDIYLPYLSKW